MFASFAAIGQLSKSTLYDEGLVNQSTQGSSINYVYKLYAVFDSYSQQLLSRTLIKLCHKCSPIET